MRSDPPAAAVDEGRRARDAAMKKTGLARSRGAGRFATVLLATQATVFE
jgi:hypothetical protein